MRCGRGLIHMYTGDGKGKTTAAVGLAVRARGAGLRVGFFQFMKGSPSGEIAMLEQIGVKTARGGEKTKFVSQMDEAEKSDYRERQGALFRKAVAEAGDCDVLVLDEVVGAVNAGILSEKEVAAFLDAKPEGLEVVMTGRDPSDELAGRARYVSDIRCVRHPYADGVAARKGVEF